MKLATSVDETVSVYCGKYSSIASKSTRPIKHLCAVLLLNGLDNYPKLLMLAYANWIWTQLEYKHILEHKYTFVHLLCSDPLRLM